MGAPGVEQIVTLPVGPNTVICPDDAGPPAKGDDPLAGLVGQGFVIDEPNIFTEDLLQQAPVVRLFLDGVAKEKIGFSGEQKLKRHLLDAENNIAILQGIDKPDAFLGIFPVRVTSDVAFLGDHLDVGKSAHDDFCLVGGKWYASIDGDFAFPYEAYCCFRHVFFLFQ